VNFRPRVYPDCGHAFFNDSNPYAYNEQAGGAAWAETLGFLAQTVGAPVAGMR
jgi:carboxymethylenebutenolidase